MCMHRYDYQICTLVISGAESATDSDLYPLTGRGVTHTVSRDVKKKTHRTHV